MAAVERDGADDTSSAEDNQPRARRNLSTARSDQPIFTSLRNRERITFAKKDRESDENARPGPESDTGRGNWMSGKGMKLGEAFLRTDDEGNFLPRLSARMAGSVGSRIPRTKSFSPPAASSSPSNRLSAMKDVPGRSSSAPVDSESEITGPLQGSPSPAARNRRVQRENRRSDRSQTSAREHINPSERDKKLRQHSDDQERSELLRSLDSAPLFSRAPVGPKVEETVRTLAEKTSTSSFENEPPVRVPKTWGSKAKKNSDWMAKILSPETSVEIKDSPRDISSEKQKTAADTPLPSVEDVSSVQTLTPPASRPTSARPTNVSPEKSQMWQGDLDFTAQSLQISTSPLLRVKQTNKVDEIRAREIESLTARAVATNRLEEIREKISEERPISEDNARTGLRDLDARQAQELGGPDESISLLEQNGYRVSDGPVPTQRSKADGNKANEGASQPGGHDETWETLRALSRVITSKSPSPPRMDEKEVNHPVIVGPSAGEKLGERQTSTRREISLRASQMMQIRTPNETLARARLLNPTLIRKSELHLRLVFLSSRTINPKGIQSEYHHGRRRLPKMENMMRHLDLQEWILCCSLPQRYRVPSLTPQHPVLGSQGSRAQVHLPIGMLLLRAMGCHRCTQGLEKPSVIHLLRQTPGEGSDNHQTRHHVNRSLEQLSTVRDQQLLPRIFDVSSWKPNWRIPPWKILTLFLKLIRALRETLIIILRSWNRF
jgi:hypothetical protein